LFCCILEPNEDYDMIQYDILTYVHKLTAICQLNPLHCHFFHMKSFVKCPSKSANILTEDVAFELRFYVPLGTKQVISETFFPANLLAADAEDLTWTT